MEAQSAAKGADMVALVNISSEKWPPRHRTYFGSLAKAIVGKRAPTSFERGVNSVTWVLIRFMLIMVPVVFAINGFTKGDWLQAFLFAVSVAVGLTPEMLPMLCW